METNIKPNYKNKKSYKTNKRPIRQPLFLTGLIWVLSKIMLSNKEYKVEKINMDGLKPPYFMISNHMCFADFELAAMVTGKYRVNNVVNIDGFYKRDWLLELIGAICTRKFTTDLGLIRSINHVFKRGDIVGLYPEARYSPCGIRSYIPDSLGKIIKMNKVPVVAIVHHGNYLHAPFWNFRKKRKVPLYTTATQILTKEQIESMSVAEINSVVQNALEYNEYEYQKNNGILITEPYRAEGLHKILYQCPHCKTESKMASKGTEIFCTECGKRWNLNEDGTLSALDGETEFPHIPDWFLWERSEVEKQIEKGEYRYEDQVEVYSMPRCWKFHNLGKATLTHDVENGFTLSGHYRNQDYYISRKPLQINSLHVEYDFQHLKPIDCIDISTEDDSFYCYPSKENIVTKLAFATEIIYQKNLNERRN